MLAHIPLPAFVPRQTLQAGTIYAQCWAVLSIPTADQRLHIRMLKQALAKSGLLSAAELSPSDQQLLRITYHFQLHDLQSYMSIPLTYHPDRALSERPTLVIAGNPLYSLLRTTTSTACLNWIVTHAVALAHEFAHLRLRDSLSTLMDAQSLVESFCQSNNRTSPDLLKYIRYIAAHPLEEPTDPVGRHHAYLQTAAQEYLYQYQGIRLIKDFWRTAGTPYQVLCPRPPLNHALLHATWLCHYQELRADKQAILTVLNWPVSLHVKLHALRSELIWNMGRIIGQQGDRSPSAIDTHPPYSRRMQLLHKGLEILKYARTTTRLQQLDALTIPDYIPMPAAPNRSPRAYPGSS